MKPLILITLLACSGCISRRIDIDTKNGHKLHFNLPSLGSKSKVKSIELQVDGVVIRVEGYESDQVEAFKAGVAAGEKAVKSAALP